MDRARFRRLVQQALDSLPPEVKDALNNVAVVIEREPSHADLRAAGDHAHDDDLFGLYVGHPLTSRGDYSMALPDRIVVVLAVETWAFLREVPVLDFLFGREWTPLFAVPLFGLRRAQIAPPWWVKVCAVSGLLMTALYVGLSVLPIIPVGSRTVFAMKIIGLIVVTNAIGLGLYVARGRRTT